MGNQKSIESKNFADDTIRDFYNSTQFVRDSDDPCFGEISIFKRRQKYSMHPEEQLVFMKQKQEPNKAEYTELYRECDLRLKYSHPNLLDFLGYDFKCQQNLCGTTNRCALYFQYFERDLEHEINKRAVNQNYFEEKEVLYLLESLASAGAYLQQQHIYHGDLRPLNIFITPNGKVKIGDHLLLNQYRNNFFKTFILGAQDTFLSPQLMFALNEMEREPQYDEFKADVWSLGLTILEVCSLCPSIQCYDFQDNTISYTKIQELLSRASQNYSYELISKIKIMLEEDERIRPDMIQLYQMFQNPMSSAKNSMVANNSRFQNSTYGSPVKVQSQNPLSDVSRIQNLYQTGHHVRQASAQPQNPAMQQTRFIPAIQQSTVAPAAVGVPQVQQSIIQPQPVQFGQTSRLQQQPVQQQAPVFQPQTYSRIVVPGQQGTYQSQIIDQNAQTIKPGSPQKGIVNNQPLNIQQQQQHQPIQFGQQPIQVQDQQQNIEIASPQVQQIPGYQQKQQQEIQEVQRDYEKSLKMQENKFDELQSRIKNALTETTRTLEMNQNVQQRN